MAVPPLPGCHARSTWLDATEDATRSAGADGPWQGALPESVKVPIDSCTKRQSYPLGCSVRFRTPNVSVLRTSLLGAIEVIEVWLDPPVPTTNSRMPRV